MKPTALFFLSLFLFCLNKLTIAQSPDRPNILFILTDDQRWDALGYAGNEVIQTPEMDRLAAEGLYFENAFVTTPICAASRASIITGMYERTHGFTFGTPPLAQSYVDISYPRLLHEAGYRTGFFGKLGMNLAGRSDTSIFDEIYTTGTNGYFRLVGEGSGEHVHLTDHTTDRAIEFIKNGDGKQPFCLSVSYNAPHADDASPQQYFWPARHDSLYADVSIPGPALGDPAYLEALPPFLRDSLYMGRIRWRWRYDSPEKYQRMVKGYYRMITTIDDNIGRLRQTLEDMGLADNTIIILMADNGYFLGERQLAGKWLMYDNSLRVPLILYDPQAGRQETVSEMALNIDIAPTILDYAGLEVPAAMQGRSLRPFTEKKVADWRESFFCEHLFDLEYIPKSEGVRTQRWKYFRYLEHPETEELYDLANDPLEVNNLAGKPGYQDRLAKFRRQVEQGMQALEAAGWKKR